MGHPWLRCPGEAKAGSAGRLRKALRGPGAHLDSRSPGLIVPSRFSLSSPCVCDDVQAQCPPASPEPPGLPPPSLGSPLCPPPRLLRLALQAQQPTAPASLSTLCQGLSPS